MNKNVLYTQDSPIPIYSMVTWTETIAVKTGPFRCLNSVQRVGCLVDVYGQTAQVRNTETGDSVYLPVHLLKRYAADGDGVEAPEAEVA